MKTRTTDWPQDGMLIPMAGEAAWVRPAGRQARVVGHVHELDIGWRLDRGMALVHAHAAEGGVLLPTPGATRDGTLVRGLFKF